MELNDKYFHSIHSYLESYGLLDGKLLKLKRILESGSILSKEKILLKYGSGDFHPIKSSNGNYCVSVSKYNKIVDEYDKKYKADVASEYFEDAFLEFVLQEPSIVLNSNIEKELKMYEGDMYLERQILNEIPLKYMEAVSVFSGGELKPFFEEVQVEYFDAVYESGYIVKELDRIIDLLKEFGYDVPIVSICSGICYNDNIEYRKYLKTKSDSLKQNITRK